MEERLKLRSSKLKVKKGLLSVRFKVALCLGLSFMGSVLGSNSAEAVSNNTRATNPSALVLELGGRGFLYNLGFDRVLNDNFAAGIGIGSISTTVTAAAPLSLSSIIIPVYFNFYFSQDAGSLYVTGGADLVTSASNWSGLSSSPGGMNFSSSPILLTFGVGYEVRSDAGYLVRVAGYGIYGSNLVPWGGLTFGYSF